MKQGLIVSCYPFPLPPANKGPLELDRDAERGE